MDKTRLLDLIHQYGDEMYFRGKTADHVGITWFDHAVTSKNIWDQILDSIEKDGPIIRTKPGKFDRLIDRERGGGPFVLVPLDLVQRLVYVLAASGAGGDHTVHEFIKGA